MHLICFGHKPPRFSIPYAFTLIAPRPIGGIKTLPIDELRSFQADEKQAFVVSDGKEDPEFGDVLSEYMQFFALARLLVQLKISEPLYLFQYRKCISLRLAGQKATNVGYAQITEPTEMTWAFPSPDELAALNGKILRGPEVRVGNLAGHYAIVHLADDLALFTVVLRELGILTRDQCARFLRAERFVPAPALGMYPARMLVRHAAILRKAWSGFYRSYYVERGAEQRRVGGFLLERLHSFLVSEDVASGGTSQTVTGHMLVASDGESAVLTSSL